MRLFHDPMRVAATLGTVPLAFGFTRQFHALEVEPLDLARVVVAQNHLSVGDLAAQTVDGLVFVQLSV